MSMIIKSKNETHLDDQLKELNNYSKDVYIEYTLGDGNKMIPKSINVCKLYSHLYLKRIQFFHALKMFIMS